eukprot:GEMP01059991.1.p1 GENE.GEMP01059991.1~~GEMP01059991.1.p1  ORF type:complete len:365 (+),score=56.85 GEMP01059991.1:30-1124(+)
MEVVYSATESGAFAHDLHTGALLNQFDDSGAPFVLNGPYMCSISKALLYVHAWGQKTPCYRASLPEKMTAVQMAPAVIISGGISGKIYAWHASSGHLLHSWTAHYKAVTSLAVENNWLVSGSEDGQVLLWNLADLQKPVQHWSHALPVTDVKITPGRQPVVVSSSLDHTVREWDVTGPCIRSHTLPAKVLGLAVSLGQIIACGDGLLMQLGDQKQDWQVPCGVINSVSLNTDGCILATSSNSVDRVRIWDSRTRQALRGLKYPVDRLILGVSIAHRTHALPFPTLRPLQRVMNALPDTIAVPVSHKHGNPVVAPPSMNDWSDILLAQDTLFSDDLLAKVEALQEEVHGWRSAAHELWDHMQSGK